MTIPEMINDFIDRLQRSHKIYSDSRNIVDIEINEDLKISVTCGDYLLDLSEQEDKEAIKSALVQVHNNSLERLKRNDNKPDAIARIARWE